MPVVKPSQEIVDASYVKNYDEVAEKALAHPEAFWEEHASELQWFKHWDQVLEWKYPYASWFKGAQVNIVANALDRHLKTDKKDKLALIWVGQDGSERRFTYQQMADEVGRLANGFKSLGVKKGDRVSMYLPRVPEQFFVMLACAKIGAIHSVVYSGFSSDALKTRIEDAEAKVIVTLDGYQYHTKFLGTKKIVDDAIVILEKEHPSPIQKVVVVKRSGCKVQWIDGRDIWYEDLVKTQDTNCPTEVMDARDPLFILYTSGTTGKPKGVLHGHGGYMVGIYTTLKYVFNLQEDDIYWCTADPGWITGHSYIVYSPLINGVTSFIYEGPPNFPDEGIWWKLIEKYKITKFYTTPTAVRALMRMGDEIPNKFDKSSLKILGSVGEPINPEAWEWYYKVIGGGKCPIMDTWWQTETGAHVLTPLPTTALKPGSCFKPFPGIEVDIVDENGKPVDVDTQGYLVIKNQWPSQLLDLYKNPDRYKETYWNKIPGVYFTGDSAKRDADGYFWILGRNDDVLKVSGYRFGSAELEKAFDSHPAVAEAAVIGKPHEIKGESIKAFIILKEGHEANDALKAELKQQVRKMVGPIATPDEIEFVTSLPKTRSGKIMRRVLKAQELGQPVGDTSTLES